MSAAASGAITKSDWKTAKGCATLDYASANIFYCLKGQFTKNLKVAIII